MFDAGTPYRGYRWFDRYEPVQLAALSVLVYELGDRFSIPRVYLAEPYRYYGDTLRSFQGVIGHAMVCSDKSDPAPDPRLWQELEEAAELQPIPVAASALASAIAPPLTQVEVPRLAGALGFQNVTDRSLEVRHA